MDLDRLPRLAGNGIVLRELHESDAAQRASLGRRREIVRAFGGDLDQDQPMSEQDAGSQLAWRFGPGPHWVIADAEDAFLGTVRLAPVDVDNRSARFGIGIFDPDKLGQGIGTEATRLVVRYGFAELGLHRISLTVLADNTRAIAAYERAGFEVEGRLRQTLWRDGVWHDDLAMALLAPAWERRSAS